MSGAKNILRAIGANPYTMTLPESLYKRYSPAADSFLKSICPLVTDSALEAIAAYDRGYIEDETFPILQKIRDNQNLPASICSQAREVLRLGRWSHPIPSDKEGHIKRAFCGAVFPDLEDNFSDHDTLIITLESVGVIGIDAGIALLRFLLWCAPQETSWHLENRPFYALVILSLLLQYDASLTTYERESLITYFYWAESQEATWEGELSVSEEYRSIISPYYGVHGDLWTEWAVRLKANYPSYSNIVALADHLIG